MISFKSLKRTKSLPKDTIPETIRSSLSQPNIRRASSLGSENPQNDPKLDYSIPHSTLPYDSGGTNEPTMEEQLKALKFQVKEMAKENRELQLENCRILNILSQKSEISASAGRLGASTADVSYTTYYSTILNIIVPFQIL